MSKIERSSRMNLDISTPNDHLNAELVFRLDSRRNTARPGT